MWTVPVLCFCSTRTLKVWTIQNLCLTLRCYENESIHAKLHLFTNNLIEEHLISSLKRMSLFDIRFINFTYNHSLKKRLEWRLRKVYTFYVCQWKPNQCQKLCNQEVVQQNYFKINISSSFWFLKHESFSQFKLFQNQSKTLYIEKVVCTIKIIKKYEWKKMQPLWLLFVDVHCVDKSPKILMCCLFFLLQFLLLYLKLKIFI